MVFTKTPLFHRYLKVILAQLIAAINRQPNSHHDKIMFTSLFTLMYHALLRVSEVTYSKKNSHNLLPNQVLVNTLRIAKPTHMAKDGSTDTQICMAGRWSSLAFKQHIKPQLLQLSN